MEGLENNLIPACPLRTLQLPLLCLPARKFPCPRLSEGTFLSPAMAGHVVGKL